MSVIPPTVLVPAAMPAPTSAAATDADLAGVFAALVDSLQAQLTSGEQRVEPTLDPGEDPTDAEPAEGDPPLAGMASISLWPMSVPTPVVVDGGTAPSVATPATAPSGATPNTEPSDAEAGAAVGGDVEAALVADHGAAHQVDDTVGADLLDTSVPADADGGAASVPETRGEGTDLGPHAEPEAPSEATLPSPAAEEVQSGADVPVAMAPGPAGPAEASATAGSSSGVTAPTTASAPTEVAAAPSASRPQAPALPDQLVQVIAPLRRGVDGSHQVSIQLRPDELGEVLVEMHLRGNEINVNLRADLPGTSDLLRAALDELRAQLEAAGFRSGALDVGSHAERRAGHDRGAAPHPDTPTAGDPAAGTLDNEPRPVAAPSAGLDLRI